MAQKSQRLMVATTTEERAFDELAASRGDLVGAVVRAIEFSVEQMKLTPDEARMRFRTTRVTDPDAIESDQVSWLDLSALGEQSPEKAQALWQRVKSEAANELATGARVAKTLERPLASRPSERAAFFVIVGCLRQSLQPRDGLEQLLIHQMASAFELQLRWQAILVRRMEEEVWQGDRDKRRELANMSPSQRERYESENGWLPPRLAETEALEQAQLLADRYQRSFLRLMKAYRDNRRMFSSLVVAGGQVNIGEQQINVAENASTAPNSEQARPKRRITSRSVNKCAKTA